MKVSVPDRLWAIPDIKVQVEGGIVHLLGTGPAGKT